MEADGGDEGGGRAVVTTGCGLDRAGSRIWVGTLFAVGVEELLNVRGSECVTCMPAACILTLAAGNDWSRKVGKPKGTDWPMLLVVSA